MNARFLKSCIGAAAIAAACAASADAGDFDSFILDGVPVQDIKEIPWQVALLNGTSTVPFQFCGGSIIAPQWILTAAHCVEGRTPAQIDILAGTVFKTGTDGVRVDSAAIFVHPKWGQVPSHYDFDAALIRLKEPLTVGAAIELATDATDLPVPFSYRVSGWGATSEGGPSSNQLLRVDVPMVTLEACQKPYGDAVSDKMICLGETGRDSCQGDSGGPAVKLGTPNVLVGIVSWGWGCGQEGYYGVYTKVSAVKDWVDATVSASQ